MIIRNSMKALVATLGVTAMIAGASTAQAITFDPDGAGAAGSVANVTQLDWAPGNSLAVGGQTAVNNFQANQGDQGNRDTTFTTYYQASLQAFATSGGVAYAPAGWEITVVAKFKENVTIVAGTTAFFGVVNDADNYVEIYAHRVGDAGTAVANNLAGTGFNDGNLILKGVITGGSSLLSVDPATVGNLDQNGSDNYSGQQSVATTLGTTQIFPPQITVTSRDAAYFQTALDSLTLSFSGTQQLPFLNVDPSGAFLVTSGSTATGVVATAAGAGAPSDTTYGIGTVNGIDGPSVQVLTDGNSALPNSTPAVPEPATAAMGVIALVGLAAAARRRRA